MPSTHALVGRLGGLRKNGVAEDDPRYTEAKQNVAEAMLDSRIREVVEKAPPLRTEQIDRLAMLLRRDAA